MSMAIQLLLTAIESKGGELHPSGDNAAESLFDGITSFNFTFESALLCLSLLIILSIIFDKLGVRLGMPGSILLFFTGLFFHLSGYSFELFPLEQLHVVALSILLFFSGLSFESCLLRTNKVFPNSVLLAIFGTFISMLFWLLYLGIGFSFFQINLGYLKEVPSNIVWLTAVPAVFSLAVQDWNSFVFVSKKNKRFQVCLVQYI